jgi:iron complex outermembrane receptor protein
MGAWPRLLLIGVMMFNHLASSSELEVIEVTAQYKKQSLQDVPISASVFNNSAIERLQIENSTQIANFSPGVSYTEFAPGQALLAMRGIVSADDGAAIDSSVVAFVDGVYLGRLANLNFVLLDIERIEVLRGPQGTLFGRNAIGGAINIITRQPRFEKNARMVFTQGSYNLSESQFSAGTLATANSAFNISFKQSSRDGYSHNVLRNEPTQDENAVATRLSVLTELDNARWYASFDHHSEQKQDMGRTPIANGNYDYVTLLKTLGGGDYKNASPISGFSNRRSTGLALNYERFYNDSQFNAIAAWRSSLADWEMASVGAPLNGQYDLNNGVLGADVNDDIWDKTNQHSLELRWQREFDDTFSVTSGFFYLAEDTYRSEQYKLDMGYVNAQQITLGNEVSKQTNDTTSYALYTSIDWLLSERLQLLAGARLSYDHKNAGFTSLNCHDQHLSFVALSKECSSERASLGIIGTSFITHQSNSWLDFSPRLVLQYHLNSNEMTYLSLTKGYKAGGYVGSPGVKSAADQGLNPEKAYSYELGYKGNLAENSLSLALSAFYTDYRDLQVTWFGPSVENPGFGSFISTNIDKATIKGVEASLDWQLNSRVNVQLQYGYLDTEIDEFVISTLAGVKDLTGSSLRQAPKNKFALNTSLLVYETTNAGSYRVEMSVYGQSQQLADYINQVQQIEGYTLANIALKWVSDNGHLSIKGWYSNVLNKTYIAHLYTTGAGAIGTYGAPRQFGLTLTWHYG